MRINKLFVALSLLLLAIALFFGILFVRSFHKSVDVKKVLNTLPKEDRESLEWLFRHFWVSSYVLFGNKPIAIHCMARVEPYDPQIFNVYTFMDSITRCHMGNLVDIKGWEAWKKYKYLFPSSNFIILENCEPDLTTIFFINKRAFLKTVEENIDYFREALGAKITPQSIFDNCLKSNDIRKGLLKNHDGLFGILLGFGRHNAHSVWRRVQIGGMNKSKEFSLMKKTLIPSPGFSTIYEEYDTFNSRVTAFDDLEADDFNPLTLRLPCFAADHGHPETQQLKIDYTKQYKNIVQKYKNGDFLEVTLRQFCGS